MTTAEAVTERLRRFLLLLATLAFLTTLAELWLEKHTQELLQWLPWGLCVLGLLAVGAAWFRPTRAGLLALRAAMVVVALGGAGGIIVHLLENLDFEREVHAGAAVGASLLAALTGAAPLLAPGALTFAALIALAATYYHPALNTRAAREALAERGVPHEITR